MVRLWCVAGMVMLTLGVIARASAPSPFAPRVHVRWSAGVDDDQRAALERRFSLLNGERRQGETWEYDLVDLAAASVTALVAHPAVADTHYIERSAGQIASDAPAGTVRLGDRPLAAFLHSFVFDWFIVFWASSIFVSGVWLASDRNARD
jgi:hypothetical protein